MTRNRKPRHGLRFSRPVDSKLRHYRTVVRGDERSLLAEKVGPPILRTQWRVAVSRRLGRCRAAIRSGRRKLRRYKFSPRSPGCLQHFIRSANSAQCLRVVWARGHI